MTLFNDRRDAGRQLAAMLGLDGNDSVVLGLSRGGVPVAFEVARMLGKPLDVFVVRKLGVPGQPEVAMGAIASGGGRAINSDIVAQLDMTDEAIEEAIAEERDELARRQRMYRGWDTPAAVYGRHVILVDDGLATGASMRAALDGVRALDAGSVTIAVPVAARDTCAWFTQAADQLVCLETPEPFGGVGRWYRDFGQTSDDEVCRLLGQARAIRRSA